ncbi:hypothetical protein A2V82_10865 [candidate division KSB1 bacterium RBG_16_48_16]|nr:MAG: hypothetical protein A2V82_10865 [candidate division KSB1 bacterium RBG_16_48_16]
MKWHYFHSRNLGNRAGKFLLRLVDPFIKIEKQYRDSIIKGQRYKKRKAYNGFRNETCDLPFCIFDERRAPIMRLL